MARQQNWSQSISFVNSGLDPRGRHLRHSRPAGRMEAADDGPGLMTSRAFWLGGALSLGFWTLLALLLRSVF